VVWEGIDARFRFGGDVRFASPGKSLWSLKGTPLRSSLWDVCNAHHLNQFDIYENHSNGAFFQGPGIAITAAYDRYYMTEASRSSMSGPLWGVAERRNGR
jgi:hypothetical protein